MIKWTVDRVCVICDSNYVAKKYNSLVKCCSKECSSILRSRNTSAAMTVEQRACISAKLKGIPKSEDIKRKMSLAQLGNTKGAVPCSVETKKKISLANAGRVASLEARQRMSLSRIGNTNRKGTSTSEIGKKNMSEAHKGFVQSKATILKRGKAIAEARVEGRKRVYGYYKEYAYSSSWEVTVAKWLEDNNYIFTYEPKAFKTSEGYYVPDFYVEGIGYIEVTGLYCKSKKMDAFVKEHEPLIWITDISNINLSVRWSTP